MSPLARNTLLLVALLPLVCGCAAVALTTTVVGAGVSAATTAVDAAVTVGKGAVNAGSAVINSGSD